MKKFKFKINSKEKQGTIHYGAVREISKLILENQTRKVFILTDDNVYRIYKEFFEEVFQDYDVYINVIPAGEASKDMDMLKSLYTELSNQKMTRNDLIIALGGGVIGDLCGFAASTYLRGIELMQIPTTVLSQVDSSVGGKTAINFDGKKNQIGAFYQPENVIVDMDFLRTLPKGEFANGCAEIIKYGCILDEKLFDRCRRLNISTLLDDGSDKLESIISRCIELKTEIVKMDELDKGIRNILNFGHTIGHAIEADEKYGDLKHGEAVAVGMYLMSRWGEIKGHTKGGVSKLIKEALIINKLPYTVESCFSDDMYTKITGDKKASGDAISLIVIKDIGAHDIIKISMDEVKDMLGVMWTVNEEERKKQHGND